MDTTSKIMGTNVRILPLLCSSLLYFAFNIADIIWPHFIGLSQEAEKEQWGQNRNKVVFELLSSNFCPLLILIHTVKSRAVDLVGQSRIFRLFMKGKFDAYVLWPLTKRFQNWIVDRSTARDFTVCLIICFGGAEIMFFFYFWKSFSHPTKSKSSGVNKTYINIGNRQKFVLLVSNLIFLGM